MANEVVQPNTVSLELVALKEETRALVALEPQRRVRRLSVLAPMPPRRDRNLVRNAVLAVDDPNKSSGPDKDSQHVYEMYGHIDDLTGEVTHKLDEMTDQEIMEANAGPGGSGHKPESGQNN